MTFLLEEIIVQRVFTLVYLVTTYHRNLDSPVITSAVYLVTFKVKHVRFFIVVIPPKPSSLTSAADPRETERIQLEHEAYKRQQNSH